MLGGGPALANDRPRSRWRYRSYSLRPRVSVSGCSAWPQRTCSRLLMCTWISTPHWPSPEGRTSKFTSLSCGRFSQQTRSACRVSPVQLTGGYPNHAKSVPRTISARAPVLGDPSVGDVSVGEFVRRPAGRRGVPRSLAPADRARWRCRTVEPSSRSRSRSPCNAESNNSSELINPRRCVLARRQHTVSGSNGGIDTPQL